MARGSRWSELLPYAALSGTTLLVDFIVFAALSGMNVPAFAANLASSAIAALCLYLISSLKVFRAKPRLIKGVLFLSWYGAATLFWSLLIGLAASSADIQAIYWKLLFTPLSFFANYLFSRRLIKGKER